MKLIKNATETLWAQNKYDVMAKGYAHYQEIKLMFKHAATIDDFYNIFLKIKSMKSDPYSTKAAINTLEHIWGYFKREATLSDKADFFSKLTKLQSNHSDLADYEELSDVFHVLHQLLGKYPNPYLHQCTFLFPDRPWNEVTIKGRTFRIVEEFYTKT